MYMNMMKVARSMLGVLALSATGSLPSNAFAQDALNSILRNTTTTKPTLVVFDIRPATVSLGAVHEAILGAFRVHYDGLKAHQELAPYPLPAGAPRMRFVKGVSAFGEMNVPVCEGATSQITAQDSSGAKYGDGSVIQACAFPYKEGVRVNFFASYIETSGGKTSLNVMGGALGRLFTRAVGIGDSSKFIDVTVDELESRFRALSPSTLIVEMQPAREGKAISPDPAIPLLANATNAQMPGHAASTNTPLPNAANASYQNPATPIMPQQAILGAMTGNPGSNQDKAALIASSPRLSALLAKYPNYARLMMATGSGEAIPLLEQQLANPSFAVQFEKAAADAEARIGSVPQSQPQTTSPSDPAIGQAAARKELSAMGLTYFSQEQFVDAIMRQDKLACTLFLQGQGVTVSMPDKSGRYPLKVPTNADISALLKAASSTYPR